MAADLSALVSLASLQSLLYQSVASTSLLSTSLNIPSASPSLLLTKPFIEADQYHEVF